MNINVPLKRIRVVRAGFLAPLEKARGFGMTTRFGSGSRHGGLSPRETWREDDDCGNGY